MQTVNVPVSSDISDAIEDLELQIRTLARGARVSAAAERAKAMTRARMTGVIPPELQGAAALPDTGHITRKALIWHLLRTGLAHTNPKAADKALRASGIRKGRPVSHK